MTLSDQIRIVRAKIIEAESALAAADAAASEELRAIIDRDDLAKVEKALARSVKAVNALHRAAAKATSRDDVVSPQFGK